MTKPDARQVIADILAAHTVVIIDEHGRARVVRCACGNWSAPSDHHLGAIEGAHRLHRADAIVAALDGRLLADISTAEFACGPPSFEPSAEAYLAAAAAYDAAVSHQLRNQPGVSVFGEHGRQIWAEHPAFRAAVDAVWPLAGAAGRAQAAADIRAQDPPHIPNTRGTYVASYSVREWAARIAEGRS